MQNEMIALILKDLPNQTAGVLKSYLEEADKNKAALTVAQASIAGKDGEAKLRNELITKLQSEIQDLKGKIIAQDAMAKREADVKERERTLEVQLLKNDILSLNRENHAIMELTRTVFKNPTYTKHVAKNVIVPVPGGGTYAGHTVRDTESETTTETVD